MEKEREQTHGTFWGRVPSVIALVFCVPLGIYFVSIAIEFVGIVFGVVSYALGARRLGIAWPWRCAWWSCSWAS